MVNPHLKYVIPSAILCAIGAIYLLMGVNIGLSGEFYYYEYYQEYFPGISSLSMLIAVWIIVGLILICIGLPLLVKAIRGYRSYNYLMLR